MQIKEIAFVDLYLSKDGKEGLIKGPHPVNGTAPLSKMEDIYLEDARDLADKCLKEELNHDEYLVKHDGVTYRAAVLKSMGGMYRVLRRQPPKLIKLAELGVHQSIVDDMLRPEFKGFVLVCGKTSSGKTTTAAAIVEARVSLFDGVAITIEDPPEPPLDGQHGNGRIFQTYVEPKSGGFPEALRRTVRMAPDIIFLGEIRDEQTAKEAVKASLNGHFIIATMHAGSPQQAIERLIDMSGQGDNRTMLSEGLQYIIYQEKIGKSIEVKTLSLLGKDAHAIRTKIRKGDVNRIEDDIEMQFNKRINGGR